MRALDAEDGITLVEIMVTLTILGVVLSAFLQAMTGGLRQMSNSSNRQDTSQLSTQAIEVLRTLSPAEIALYSDPAATVGTEIDVAALSDCTASVDDDGDGTPDRTPAGWDPDGTGPLDCEELVVRSQGAIADTLPYHGTVDTVTVTTVATAQADGGVQSGVTRVTVLLEYVHAGATEQVRRQAFFSEVSRG